MQCIVQSPYGLSGYCFDPWLAGRNVGGANSLSGLYLRKA